MAPADGLQSNFLASMDEVAFERDTKITAKLREEKIKIMQFKKKLSQDP